MPQESLSFEYLSSLCHDLYLIIKAGISFDEGLGLMEENEKNPHIKGVISSINEGIEKGVAVSVAFAGTGLFPAYMINMLVIGEKTGNLDRVFRSLANYYIAQKNIADAIRRAVTFPAMLFLLMLAVIGVLVVQVLPIFNEVLKQLGANMSPIAITFMKIGLAINSSRYIILAVFLAILLIALVVHFVPNWRQGVLDTRDRIFSGTKLGVKIGAARFAAGMTMGLSSGLDLDASLEMAGDLCKNSPTGDKAEKCRDLISGGTSIAESVAQSELFEPIHCRMLAIGLKTGAAETVMEEIAKQSEDKVQDDIELAIGRIEPVFVVIMSLMVGFVLLSVMIPMMGIMSTIG